MLTVVLMRRAVITLRVGPRTAGDGVQELRGGNAMLCVL